MRATSTMPMANPVTSAPLFVNSPIAPCHKSTAGPQARETIKEFGAAVKAERTRLGLTQHALAKRAGFHRSYLTEIECGARNLSLETVCKLAAALGVSLPALFNSRENNNHTPESAALPSEAKKMSDNSDSRG
jgi:DNA-binding XRE family transcriptional regulator